MEFIGLKDKLGNNINVGDIVKYSSVDFIVHIILIEMNEIINIWNIKYGTCEIIGNKY